jgi:hypothetical protein
LFGSYIFLKSDGLLQLSGNANSIETPNGIRANTITNTVAFQFGDVTFNKGAGVDTTVRSSGQPLRFQAANTFNVQLQAGGGNVLIGTTTDAGFKLAVNGGTQVDGDFQLGYTGVNTRNINFSQQFSPTIIDARIRAVTNAGLKLNIEGVASELDIVNIASSRPASLTSRDSILRLDTTTKAFLPPRMTTAQKNAIRESYIIFDKIGQCAQIRKLIKALKGYL